MFPSNYYWWDDNKSPRFTTSTSHTVRDAHKALRSEIYGRFSRNSGLFLYYSDLSSCHARVVMLFRSQANVPLLYKSFADKDLYLEIALQLKREVSGLKLVPDKLLLKIIKIKSLAMLNCGGLRTAKHINGLVAQLYSKDSKEFKALMKVLLLALAELPIVKEFKLHRTFITSLSEVYTVTHGNKIISTGSRHILSSPVLCGVETLAITFLVEYFGTCNNRFLPLASIHDGVTWASQTELSFDELLVFHQSFSKFLQDKFQVPVPIESQPVGISYTPIY